MNDLRGLRPSLQSLNFAAGALLLALPGWVFDLGYLGTGLTVFMCVVVFWFLFGAAWAWMEGD